jgi:signal transduction histidine kinase
MSVIPSDERSRKPLGVLLVEDCEADAALLLHELRRGGYDVSSVRVQTDAALRDALKGRSWDVVLSDYSMPSFSAPEALAIVRNSQPDLPFIIVSGTIGEETAVSALKAGACDFLVKGRLARFLPALERELREVELRRERARTQAALEEQLRQAQKMEAIGQLAGGIAHDFNNLLTAILGYGELLTEQIGPDKPMGRDLREITAAAERAAALTRQLLAFSRKQVLTMTAVDLNLVVKNLEAMLRRLIGERIRINAILDERLPTVIADATQLEQVIMNLCVNARDAMPAGGTVTIRTEFLAVDGTATDSSATGLVRMMVTDTGTGIPPEIKAKIFEPFFTTKDRGHGTGLGLAAVHGIVAQLGGSIVVESTAGQGTTFQICLPASEVAVTPTVAPPDEAKPIGGETILLVEDESGVRSFVRLALQRFGYRVVEADSGEAALALLTQLDRPIDLLLSDVVLNGMGGRELAAQVKQLSPTSRTLFMSGYAEKVASANGVLDPEVSVLEKPFTSRALLVKVRRVLDESLIEPQK